MAMLRYHYDKQASHYRSILFPPLKKHLSYSGVCIQTDNSMESVLTAADIRQHPPPWGQAPLSVLQRKAK